MEKINKKKNLSATGKSITLKELKSRIQESEEDIQNKNVLTLKDVRKKVKIWK